MKAIRIHEFGDPEVLQLEEVADLTPGAGQVVVRMHAVGVNPVETYIRSGIYPKPPTPFTPGSDGAGVVEAVGEGVDRVAVGDRVYLAGSLSGTYAEQALCKQEQVHPLGDQASFAQGAAVFVPYATAYQALFHCGHARTWRNAFRAWGQWWGRHRRGTARPGRRHDGDRNREYGTRASASVRTRRAACSRS